MADENVSRVLSSVFSNTELMEKISGIVKNKKGESAEDALPEIISAISENVKIPTQGEEKSSEADEGSKDVSAKPGFRSTGDSSALLCALKPFLNKERRDLVDNILKFEQLAALVKLTR